MNETLQFDPTTVSNIVRVLLGGQKAPTLASAPKEIDANTILTLLNMLGGVLGKGTTAPSQEKSLSFSGTQSVNKDFLGTLGNIINVAGAVLSSMPKHANLPQDQVKSFLGDLGGIITAVAPIILAA